MKTIDIKIDTLENVINFDVSVLEYDKVYSEYEREDFTIVTMK